MSAADAQASSSALPPGTRLHEFELGRVLGIGGFGIVYLGFDHALEREVAIKEYMPSSLAARTESMAVSLLSQSNAESFATGLRSFVNEARLLARFDDPSLVKVHRYWEANHTAYMAMRYCSGPNLKQARERLATAPDEAWLRSLLVPLLGALERLHAEGIYHRDIAPDNIIIEAGGQPVLLDFGAARRVLGDRSQTLTAILKPAYAPIEQYGETGGVKQGPWTDLYALGATMHFLLLGRPPAPATARTVLDDGPALADVGLPNCSTAFLACIDWMLQPRPADRPQSVAALRAALEGRVAPPVRAGARPGRADAAVTGNEPTVLDVGSLPPPPALAPPVDEPTLRVSRPPPDEPTQRLVPQTVVDEPRAPPAVEPEPARAAPVPERTVAAPPPPVAAGSRTRWSLGAGAAALAALGAWFVLRSPMPTPVAPPAAPAASLPAAATERPGGPASVSPAAPAMQTAPAAAEAARAAASAAQSRARAVPAVRAAAASRPAIATPQGLSTLPRMPTSEGPSAAEPSGKGALAARPGLVPGASLTPVPASAATAPAVPTPAPAAAAVPPAATVAAPPAVAAAPTAARAAASQPPALQPAVAVPAKPPPAAEPEPMLRARKLGPAERCEGRVLVAYWACIEAQCKNVPELANHPDCLKLRREPAPPR